MFKVIKSKLVKINKEFSNGRRRNEGVLDFILSQYKSDMNKAIGIAELHPFWNGNKRTAIRFMELETKEKVPDFVYDILSNV